MAPSYASDNGIYRLLAASAGGAPLHWLDTGVLFAAEAADASLVGGLAAAGGSLVVQVVRTIPACEKARTAATADCSSRLWRTRDGGATWARLAATVDGHPLFRLDGQPDGAALFAGYYATPDASEERYARSIDEGTTWTALPPPPLGLYLSDLVQAPDGDVYAAATDSGGVEVGIYALPANDSAWRLVAPFPEGGGGSLIVSWDARGQPAALWTNASAPTESAPVALGLVRHTP